MKEIKDMQEFDQVLSGSCLVVVDFKAEWCGPCKMIAPKLEALALELKDRDVIFVKVDVDEVADVSRRAGISAMPTFHIYRNRVLVEEIIGADYSKLSAVVMKELGPATVTDAPDGDVVPAGPKPT